MKAEVKPQPNRAAIFVNLATKLSGNLTRHKLTYRLFELVAFLQLIFMTINVIPKSWKDEIRFYEVIFFVLENIDNPLEYLSASQIYMEYWIFVYMMLTFCSTIYILSNALCKSEQNNLKESSHLANFLTFHSEIFFYWIHIFYLKKQEKLEENGMGMTGIIINVIISSLKIAFCFSRVKSKIILSRKSTTHQMVTFLSKFIIPLTYLDTSSQKLVSIIFLSICTVAIILDIIQKLPEYDNLVLKIQIIASSISFYISISSLISHFISDKDVMIHQMIFMAPVFARFNLEVLNRTLRSLTLGLRDETNPFYLAHVPSLISNLKKGLVYNEDIPRFSTKLLDSLMIQEFEFDPEMQANNLSLTSFKTKVYQFVKNLLDVKLKSLKQHSILNLVYCRLISNKLKMHLKAAYFLKEIARIHQNDIPTLISINIINEKINLVRGENGPDTNKIVQIEQSFNTLKQKIESYTKLFSDFWDFLDNNELNSKLISDTVLAMSREYAEIKRFWEESKTLYIQNRYSFPFLIYGIFLKKCRNQVLQSEECIKKYNSLLIQDLIHHHSNEETEVMMFTVGASKTNLGKILSHSSNCQEAFGFKSEVIGLNINCIMPDFFALRHDGFLQNHIESGKTSILNKQVQLWGSHKEGFVFPINLEVKVEYSMDQGIIFKGMITKLQDRRDVILVDEKGLVLDFSKKIKSSLQLEKNIPFSQLLDSQLRVHQLSEDTRENAERRKTKALKNLYLGSRIESKFFLKFIQLLKIPEQNPDQLSSNSRLVNLVPYQPQRKGSIIQRKIEHKRSLIPYYLSYSEFKYEKDSLFAIYLEDWNLGLTYLNTEVQSVDELEICRERSFNSVNEKFSDHSEENIIERKIAEFPSSLEQNAKSPLDEQQYIAVPNSIASTSASLNSNKRAKIEMIEKAFLEVPRDNVQKGLKFSISIIMLLSLLIAVILFLGSRSILANVLAGLNAVNYSYQRMDSLVWVWRFAIGYQIRVNKISAQTAIDLGRQREVIMMYAPKLKAANEALLKVIWETPAHIQAKAFAKNVRMNLTNSDGSLQTTYYNTFDAVNAYLSMVVRFNKTPDSIAVVPNQTYVKYLLDNGQNDLLIETEKVIDLFKQEVSRIFNDDTFKLRLIFGFCISTLLLSMICLMIELLVYYKKARKMFRALALLSPSMLSQMKNDVKYFRQAMGNNNTKSLSKIAENNLLTQTEAAKSSKAISGKLKKKNLVLSPLIKSKLFRYITLLASIIIVLIFATIAFQKYTNAIYVYFKNNQYLTTASYNRYLYTFVIAANYYALADQYIGYIRNIPTIEAIPQVNKMISSNELTFSVFTDEDGFKNDFLEDIFEENLCPYVLYFSFPGKEMVKECAILTKNYTYALTGVNLLVYQESESISKILISNHTYANCKLLYSRFNNNVGPGTYVLGAAYEVIYNRMKAIFDEERPKLDEELINFFAIQMGVSVFLVIFLIALIHNSDKDKIFGETFTIIPITEIIKNSNVKLPILEIYGRKMDPLRGLKLADFGAVDKGV